ncbi:MAG: 5-bromo-4-chloroindolyl phosphate hydrolysis family protein [Lachnospiraceae bacterium]|nr:5-bromo-4-chloroindolyl phosphate hydrolysis family protein [Lachnospiraceae bacterium]
MGIGDRLGQAANDMINSVNDAVKSGDFSHLSSDINWQLHEMQREAADEMRKAGRQVKDAAFGKFEEYGVEDNPYKKKAHSAHKKKSDKEYQTAFTKKNKVGKDLKDRKALEVSVLLVAIACFLAFTGNAFTHSFYFLIGSAITAAVCIGMLLSLQKTNKKLKLNDIYEEYKKIVGSDEYITIDELCIQTRRPKEQIVREIKDMMDAGYLPGAVLDEDETVLILSENAYRYYVEYEKKHSAERAAKQAEKESDASLPPEARDVIEQGEKYIAEFHHLNDVIPDEAMSEKLDKLENLIQRIFSEVRKKTEKAAGLRRLLDYYLPTTKKLVQAYADAENQPDTENISQIKKEIEDSLDMINAACEKIFDEMFTDDAWDISSDINVMKRMMEQDGLVDNDMKG